MNKYVKSSALVICMLLTVISCSRQNVTGTGEAKTEVRNLSEFNGLTVNGNYEILGSPGTPEKFVVSTNENLLPYLMTSVKKGIVEVETKKSVDVHPTVAQKIWFTVPEFDSLTLNGASAFQFFDMVTNKLNITLSGSHHLLMSGKGDSLALTISGSSDVDARGLVVNDATVVINGSSTVYLNPIKTLKVTINGDGKVIYFSEAPKVDQTINGSGQVTGNFGKMKGSVPQTNGQQY